MKKTVLFLLALGMIILISTSAQAATSWYFPEGCTRGFDLWILATNPNSTSANITYTFYIEGADDSTHTETIAANSRKTIYVNNIIGNDADVSTRVECTNGLNIYAERAMYWNNTSFPSWTAGHGARGISGIEGCYYEIMSLPMTISQSGTYVLTGDLSLTTEDTDAITISASNVTIDLNGFTITGPGNTSGSTGSGIYCSGIYTNITIKNGNIINFRQNGINVNSASIFRIADVNSYNNGLWGIYGGTSGIIKDCVAGTNGQNTASGTNCGGIYLDDNCIIKNCIINNSIGYGIYAAVDTIIQNNTINLTTYQDGLSTCSGILADSRNTISGNNVSESQRTGTNMVYGIYISGDHNVIRENNVAECDSKDIYLGENTNDNVIIANHLTGDDTDHSLYLAGSGNYYYSNTYDYIIADMGDADYSGRTIDNALSNVRVINGQGN